MGIELAKAYINVAARADGLSKGLDDVKKQVDSAIRDIAAGAATVLGSFGAFGKGFIQSGLQAAAQFEQTTIKMETMLGSAEETKKTMADLTTFAAKTPFEMPGILQVATGMIQFGERGKELMETMKMLGDASGGDAAQFQLLGMVLNQVRGVGKLLTQDFRQLSSRGIISLQDIADYFKVTTAEAQNMLSNGKISFEDTKKILKSLTEEGGRYYKMSEKQSQSLTGLLSTLKDAWGILQRQLASSLIPIVKVFTTVLIKVLDVASAMSEEMKNMSSAALVGATAFGLLGAAIFGAVAASRLLGISLKQALIGSGVGVVVLALGAGLGLLVQWFTASAQAAGLLQNVLAVMGYVWTYIQTAATNFFIAVQDFITKHQADFEEMGALVVEIFHNLWDTAKEVFDNLLELGETVLVAMGELFNWMFGTSYTSAGQFFDAFVNWIKDVLDWISLMTTDWSLTWELIKTNTLLAVTVMADKIMMVNNTIIAAVIGAGAAMWSAIKDSTFNMWQAFKAMGIAVMAMFKGLWEGIKNKFKGKSFMEGFEQAYMEEMAKIDGETKNVGANASKAFNDSFVKNMGPDSPLKSTIDELETQSKDIKKKMEDARTKKREERKAAEIPAWQGPKLPPEIKKPLQTAQESMGFKLDAGRYGFTEIGNKIQDNMLKEKEDEQKKQTGLLEAGLSKQDEVIKAIKESGGKTATLSE